MTASKGLFKKYKQDIFYQSDVFIETGTYKGDGVQQALDEGYDEVYSIELSPKLFLESSNRFRDNKNVHLYLGESFEVLETIMDNLDQRVTFWLDGHYSAAPDIIHGKYISPLLQELEVIGRHHIKTHTIIIDDLRDWTIHEHGFNTQVLKQAILEINKAYQFKLEEGHCADDILVAYINK